MALFRRKAKTDDQPADVTVEEPRLPDPPEVDGHGWRSMADHRDYLLSVIDELPPFGQQILDALGLSLCEDVVAGIDLPGFDNSAMDGYAVVADDTTGATDAEPVLLPVVGEIAAGSSAEHPLAPGTVMKVMTGAPIPEGADAVVPYEATDRGADDVLIYLPAPVGQHIRRTGEDVTAGTTVLEYGERLRSRSIGLLAALGVDKVMVRPRPRVVVLATGSELVEPGLDLERPDQIYDSNSFMLAAAAREAGAQVFRVDKVPDDPDAMKQAIADQLVRADLILTSGGVSQGDHDVVKQVMPDLGLTDFAQVAMQPGKPQGFGLIGEDHIPMIMLPGNPVSSFVSFEAFVRPVIRKLMGAYPYVRPTVQCLAGHMINSAPDKLQLARGWLSHDAEGRRVVELVGGHGSHLIGDLARSNCLVLLPPEVTRVPAGDEVEAWLIEDETGQ